MFNRLETAAYLLTHGADPDGRAAGGSTPLYEAALRGYDPMIELLLTNRANPNLAMPLGCTPLLAYLSTNYTAAVVSALVSARANVNVSAKDQTTPLFLVAQSRSPEAHETALRARVE